MIRRGAAQARKAKATLVALACLAVYALYLEQAEADEQALGEEPAADAMLQPGIVEEIAPPWRGSWNLFSGFDDRSPLRASATASIIWNDNVLITEDLPLKDWVLDFDPALWFESSDPDDVLRHYLKIGYDPQILEYQDLGFLDAVNHRWFARYLYSGARLTAGADHRYAEFSDVSRVRDSGYSPAGALEADTVTSGETDSSQRDLTDAERDLGRSIQGSWQTTSAFAVIDLSDDAMFRPAGYRRLQDIIGILGKEEFEEWWVEGILYRESSRKLRLGLGPRFGRARFTLVNDQSYGQGLGYLRYFHSPKMRVDATVGVDYREYGFRGDHQTTPLFHTRFTWVPSERTALSIEGFQRARASFRGDAATDLGVRLAFSQNLFRRFDYSLRCGYVTTNFATATPDSGVEREDDFIFVRNALEYGFGEVGSVILFNEIRDVTSNRRPNYKQTLTGLSVGFQF